jgi:hypothetical protein
MAVPTSPLIIMKKFLRKPFSKQTPPPPETGGRITNETVAEHREKVLAGGRKFKYPLQYTKHRLLIISISLVVSVALLFLGFCAWQLYGVQTTDRFMYRLTQFVPLPVAKVDGEWVRYSDYLLRLRSAIHYLSSKEAVNFNSDDGKRQLDYQKRLAMDKAIESALVTRLAAQNNLHVNQQEVDAFVAQQIASYRLGVTEDVYRQVIRDYYDWSFDEYKDTVKQQLLRKKVNAKLDAVNRDKASQILQQIVGGADFASLAKTVSEDETTKAQGGDWGVIPKGTEDPNGLIKLAEGMQVGQVSQAIEGVEGFYIIKLTEKRDNGDLRISKILITYKLIDEKLSELRTQNKIEEIIKLSPLPQSSDQ